MTYGKEDTDYRTDGVASSGYIFNAAENTFWRRIRGLMDSQLRTMYRQSYCLLQHHDITAGLLNL